MIVRLSQKLSTKIKAGKLAELPLAANPYADWSCHLFNVGRTQYIILMNTVSFYTCLMPGKGISSEAMLLSRAKETIGGFMADDNMQFIFSKYVAPSFSELQFAKQLSRAAIGSMNEHIRGAKILFEYGVELSEIGHELNQTPMSAIGGTKGSYAYPIKVFASLADRKPEM